MANPQFAQQKVSLALQYLESALPNCKITVTEKGGDRYYNIFLPGGTHSVGGFIHEVKTSFVYRMSPWKNNRPQIEQTVKEALAWAHEQAGVRAA